MNRREAIAERIKTMRLARNMSQADLAVALRCAQSTIAMYETGKRMPDMETIDFLADIFNVPPYAILYSEAEINGALSRHLGRSLSSEEQLLVSMFRKADDRARSDALRTLIEHPREA